jgi:hypothetical protein
MSNAAYERCAQQPSPSVSAERILACVVEVNRRKRCKAGDGDPLVVCRRNLVSGSQCSERHQIGARQRVAVNSVCQSSNGGRIASTSAHRDCASRLRALPCMLALLSSDLTYILKQRQFNGPCERPSQFWQRSAPFAGTRVSFTKMARAIIEEAERGRPNSESATPSLVVSNPVARRIPELVRAA